MYTRMCVREEGSVDEFKPKDLFLGVIDLFAILLPGMIL